MRKRILRIWLRMAALLALAGWAIPVSAQYLSGQVLNTSQWREQLPAPPGDNDGSGALVIVLIDANGAIVDGQSLASGLLPLPYGPYAYSGLGATSLVAGTYTVFAWVDGDANGILDDGEPYGYAAADVTTNNVFNVKVTVQDSNDGDSLPDWWEYHWFRGAADPLGQTEGGDPDNDGLSNEREYELSESSTNLLLLNPANWDTDGDGIDDGWEIKYRPFDDNSLGLNPTLVDSVDDIDGDGLSAWQEYCGVDRFPLRQADRYVDGVFKGKLNSTTDDLNPLDIDTDYDMLLDSFEAAWYDPANGIDPKAGVTTTIPDTGFTDTSIARADPDHDGLSNYREQCLLQELRQGSANGDKWVWEDTLPFPFLTYTAEGGTEVRICLMGFSGVALNLGLVPNQSIAASTNRFLLRDHEWTDPTDGTGYTYSDEGSSLGHDTDSDWLPDGWEVQFGLDPRDDGLSGASWDNGPFGDPDGDDLWNIEEYLGQDGNRSATLPYVNGTGDETNPNEYNWRPDSTYRWRWYPMDVMATTALTDPRAGTGINRVETLGSAPPTASLGKDRGLDTDDDGIPDIEEISPSGDALASSPVHSCDPFVSRSALIVSSNGIPIPDPERALQAGAVPGGVREDLQRRDWTIECLVNLLGANMSGDLFNFQTTAGGKTVTVYRLSLSNSIPVLSSHNPQARLKTVIGKALPTNRWVHVAGVWDHARNNLGLFVDGVLQVGSVQLDESFSRYMFPAVNTNRFALAVSPDGSFVNRLMLDEVRIWGVARTQAQLAEFAHRLVPVANGDDVWVDDGNAFYHTPGDGVIVNGGSLFDGEPGVTLGNTFRSGNNYWIDNGDGRYNSDKDVLLTRDDTLVENMSGTPAGVLWNDKDGSGSFSRDSLLAYYRFDDGGSTAEDFARRAKNGLLGATREEYPFGDGGYALATNNFLWVTNGSAPVYGADKRGADDSDGDGLPDAWEMAYGLDPWDNGTGGETAAGAKDGPYGANGDPDGDGLSNLYEYWSRTNPQYDNDDVDGDRDGDGIANGLEERLGTRPDIIDTDDDGLTDGEEQEAGSNPADAGDPPRSWSVAFGGAPNDYLTVPTDFKQRLTDWSIEAWVNPTNVANGAGTILRRVVENLSGGTQAINYVLGIETNAGVLRPYAGYVLTNGTSRILRGPAIPAGTWTHLAAAYNNLNATLKLYTNGVLVASTNGFSVTPPANGRGGDTFVRIGEDFGGSIDEVRLWSRTRAPEEIAAGYAHILSAASETGLVHSFAFDDGEANTNLFSWSEFHQPGGLQDDTQPRDWNQQWRHAARQNGHVTLGAPGALVPPVPPMLTIVFEPATADAQWALDGGEWREGNVTVSNLSAGAHTVTYKPAYGWLVVGGAATNITLANGDRLTLTKSFRLESLAVAGVVVNASQWKDNIPDGRPPGNGDGAGQLRIGLWSSGVGAARINAVLDSTNALPFAEGAEYPFLFIAPAAGSYLVLAWVDGDEDGVWDTGEPYGQASVSVGGEEAPASLNLVVRDDSIGGGDELPDWWQEHWFGLTLDPYDSFTLSGTADPDNDGLDNFTELAISLTVPGMETLDPGNWDSDGDGLDDGWEWRHFCTVTPSGSTNIIGGMNPTVYNKTGDWDGDGLSDWQEYCGIDQLPRMKADRYYNGIMLGAETGSKDDLNPLDIDTDYDLLLDSFEVAWYDPANGIDPLKGVAFPSGTNIDTSVAAADPDDDGLSNYREQCLLAELRQDSTNSDKWAWSDLPPFSWFAFYNGEGDRVRTCRLQSPGAPLSLGLVADQPFSAYTNRVLLRRNAWTDPTEGTGYTDPDERIPPGSDSDDDGLPDGWEVEFGLDARDDGTFDPANGAFGDPDQDGLFNIEEFLGQDGSRSVTHPYVNGTGDETNPNEHNWRPDTTYEWRWNPPQTLNVSVTDPRAGTGISRNETLGGALPTKSLGSDGGQDTDDDGIPDLLEIHPGTNRLPSCAVLSCDPFVPRSALITSSNGIPIPDPEPTPPEGAVPGGTRRDLQRRDWTIECQVKLMGASLNGSLFDFEISNGTNALIVYRLSLSNNAPVLLSHNSGGTLYRLAGNALPTNEWIHLAAAWNHAANSLGLYVGGTLVMETTVLGECPSGLMRPATNRLALAASADGSFVNKLAIDEVRIWGVARTREQIAGFANRLVPVANGDDVWIDAQSPQFYGDSDTVIVNGGSLFDGEPGVPMNNVFQSGKNYWIDDGDGQYNAARDVLLARDATLREGMTGGGVGGVLWNDKDGSGDFSVNSLLAYYRFDDGGSSAEDFARRAKNGLLGAAREEYLFGDFGYALATNNFQWITNGAATVYGIDARGADDSDGDGLPDAWEIVNHMDPWDDGSAGETSVGAKDGPYGPSGDPDGDGLINLYEFWAGTNPRAADSDGDGVLDTQEDRDGDGVANIIEQARGSRPDMVDTDDDGLSDSQEQVAGSNPVDAGDPAFSRAVELGGASSDYLAVPMSFDQRLTDWTIEAWVSPASLAEGSGIILRRVVENLAGGGYAMNYVLGVETNAGTLRPYAGYVLANGLARLAHGPAIPAGTWTHVAAAYNNGKATLTLYVNGVGAGVTNGFAEMPPVNGKGGESFVRIGEDFGGKIDEVRLWSRTRASDEIAANYNRILNSGGQSGLVHNFAFDDGEANTNVYPWSEFHQPGGLQDYTHPADWSQQWRHAAQRRGNVTVVTPGALLPPVPPRLTVTITPFSAIDKGAQWAVDGGSWLDSGVTLSNLASGAHTITFKPVFGWLIVGGASTNITLANGDDLQLSKLYKLESLAIGCVVVNASQWKDNIPDGRPPGNGDGAGQLRIGLWTSGTETPHTNAILAVTNALPFELGAVYPVTFLAPQAGSYVVVAWIDGDEDEVWDAGEPYATDSVSVGGEEAPSSLTLVVRDDNRPTNTAGDGLPDWWQEHWFGLAVNPYDSDTLSGSMDPDNDGLDNFTELAISLTVPGMEALNPANWDTDGDGIDDGWEWRHFCPATEAGTSNLIGGMDPTSFNGVSDWDGDGLSDWQEYCGIDQLPRMTAGRYYNGIMLGEETGSQDDLNPLDIDTDYDLLIDSFEAAWYDPANGIDPAKGVALPSGTNVDLSIALADPDHDGLSNYREQCLLNELREGGTNGDKWAWSTQIPFPSFVFYVGQKSVRVCRMQSSGAPLDLGLAMDQPFSSSTNRHLLRLGAWTDPTDSTGYVYPDELIPPGSDTDDDGLPDGWEVEFGLDPKDGELDNGAFGDPDHDGMMNIEEFLGQDGNRSVTDPYINGTGDETNPNEHDWRPDSTYEWRWYVPPTLGAAVPDSRAGLGVNRGETLGGALPTKSLGSDPGADTDDDGIPDRLEIHPAAGTLPSSPVHSCDPFVMRAALITSSNGIPIPDPERAEPAGLKPGGMREDLQRRDWTIECQVKLLGTNMNGNLFDFETFDGVNSRIVYRLALSNNAPVLMSHNSGGTLYTVTGNALPTNRWIHLAGAWNHAANSLGLYSGGLLVMEMNVLGECPSGLMNPATNALALGASADGSFVNRLMIDEVRIWGVARSREQIAEFATKLVPVANGDDVWIDKGSPQFYSDSDTVIVNGGSLFDGEPGVPLNNVYMSGGNYWIDDGDGQYNAARDILLARDAGLAEGLTGSGVAGVLWNDKDGSGDFSRDSLLAYYRFDDGGSSAEDFARRAKSGLIGSAREEYLFGDFGYALATNSFQWVTNDAAMVYGVDVRGADDSDGDGLPDAWEMVNHLDPWDDGTAGETSSGAKDGPNGAKGDPDKDGLVNIYEFWAGTNPQAADTDGDGILDAQEDRDLDGGDNITEQKLGSRPDMIDTDDDGLTDSEERGLDTSPLDASDPAVARVVELDGAASDYLEVPMAFKQRLTDWTLEAWVRPVNAVDGAGYIVRRVVENLPGGLQAMNYAMGIETNAGGLRLFAGYVTPAGVVRLLSGPAIETQAWTHVAASYNSLRARLVLYVNGVEMIATNAFTETPPANGKGGEVFVRIGEDFGGRLDEVRIWNRVLTQGEIADNRSHLLGSGEMDGLIGYFAFDDGEANTNVTAWSEFHQPGGLQDYTYQKDWNQQWRHAARRQGNVRVIDDAGAIAPPPSPILTVTLLPDDALAAGAKWSVDYREEWFDSGTTLTNLKSGLHTIQYKPLFGWTAPADETVELANGVILSLARTYEQASQSVRGTIYNGSIWQDILPGPPGDGDARGQLVVGLWPDGGNVNAAPAAALTIVEEEALPIAFGPYAYTLIAPAPGSYKVMAWIDGNMNGLYDPGEPHDVVSSSIGASDALMGVDLAVNDDFTGDKLPDWWQYHWFWQTGAPFEQGPDADPDGDGLDNAAELKISLTVPGMEGMNPADWDTDHDGMDDAWEYKYYSTRYGMGLNPCWPNTTGDFDGDGLSDWQEYCGVDMIPPMETDAIDGGIVKGKRNITSDDLNPLDIDTDYDLLLDSFEAAWYDPANGIDPRAGAMTVFPEGTNVNTSIARADSDHDGLSNYREQCLLLQLRQSSGNPDKWVWEDRVPFPQLDYYADDGETRIRICPLWSYGEPLDLGLVMEDAWATPWNRFLLRAHEWTDPTEGTGYDYVDEDIPPGHDSDHDGIPDGWEVQFNLDPRDDGSFDPDNGPFGDPDGDELSNLEEFLGQDGDRSVTLPYINGTGDETNPNEYDWRPDSTYEWRWNPPKSLGVSVTDPRTGTGISRAETLGGALPTASLGKDRGTDSDDDGIPDAEEIHPPTNRLPSSPVASCDPFIMRSALITSSNGIPIPDPEPAAAAAIAPAGMREDLQRRDWSIECQVRLLGSNMNGTLFDFETTDGTNSRVVYRLSLSNNAPVLESHNSAGRLYAVAGNALPTNRWTHLAGVWNHAANSLGLYVGGLLFMEVYAGGECVSALMHPATNALALAVSPDGSFVNRLMIDEVRIWGVARTREQIAEFADVLVPPGNGDDVWLNQESDQFYGRADQVLVNGGSLFDGEPGVTLSNVLTSGNNYWIDDGDGQFTSARDIVLARDGTLAEGMQGAGVGNVLWNDKDGSGDFSASSLLAYYRFDDGGSSAEDFVRKAKNGLLGASREEFLFGDFGYALPTNNFVWVTNGAAAVYGVDRRGADDSDHDGLPDAWEMVNHLDPWDDGAIGETVPGLKNGPNGPLGDPDHDGLSNQYEYWAGTNPWAADSDGDGVLDVQEDRDGDGVVNSVEQELGSRPDLVDTDDDGFADNEELGGGTSPSNPSDPPQSIALAFGGSPTDYLEIPGSLAQRVPDWTLEAIVNPTNVTDGAGIVVRRVVQDIPGGMKAVNFMMGLETNGAGGLKLYGGYVMPDGATYRLAGGTIPAGQWTHVSASYNSLNATLSIYTNGGLVASSNVFFMAPPINGKGGETFVRIGEDFAGRIDEVRIWGVARSQSALAANVDRVLAGGDTTGLVNYFRFDDGETRTNLFPYGEFHESGGLQDYTHERDWNDEWRHAARRFGNVVIVAPGAIVPPPSLRVILDPPEVRTAGAQWCLDGGAWQNSGESLQGLRPGSHTLMFKSVTGWTKPATETVVLSNAVASTLTREYVRQASLSITIEPPEAVDAGARWRVDGGAWQSSGATVEYLDAGGRVVEFMAISGWTEPGITNIVVHPGESASATVSYTKMYGTLTVGILPPAVVTAGARWQVDGGPWMESGSSTGHLALATHTISFIDVPLWIKPGSIQVTFTSNATVAVTGVYSQVTGLFVDIQPPAAVATGAQWRLTGGEWTNSGVLVEVPAGNYTVQFKPIGAGWLPPGDASVTVVPQNVSVVRGDYMQADVFGGTAGTGLGSFYRPRGLAVDALHRLYVADTFNDRIQMYDPQTAVWTSWGAYGTNAGFFNKPNGVTVDGQGNIYVADSNNNRVQKRASSNGQWIVYGGYGTNVAKFNTPMDVAVDSRTNLYVADLGNSRVQMKDATTNWSVYLSKGTANGQVNVPQGLLIDGTDRLFVSDDGGGSNALNRIQQFTATGTWVAVLGGTSVAQGGFRRPGGMALGQTNLYVADIDNSRLAFGFLSTTGMTWQTLLSSNVLNKAQDVAWDPRGILYIADSDNNRILALRLSSGAATNSVAMTGLTASAALTNGGFKVYWFGQMNWLYAVQYSDKLTPAAWQTLLGATNIPGYDTVTNYTDGTSAGVTTRFYRVVGY